MIRRATAVTVTLAFVAACSGSDEAVPTTAIETDEPDGALVTIPTTAPESTTTASTTTRAPIEIRSFPEPNWLPVDVPTAPPVRPETMRVLVEEPSSIRYDVSPDGTWLSLLDESNRLCLAPVADQSERVCADGVGANQAVWPPDSSKVASSLSSLISGESGPLGTLATDSTVVKLLETADPASPFGGATAAGFVDDDTVIFTRMLVAPSNALTHEVHTIGVDGSNDAVVGTLEIGSGTEVFFPDAELFDGTTICFQPNGRSMAPGSWRYEPESGAIGLVGAADEQAVFAAQPVGVRPGLLVTADGERSAPSHRTGTRRASSRCRRSTARGRSRSTTSTPNT